MFCNCKFRSASVKFRLSLGLVAALTGLAGPALAATESQTTRRQSEAGSPNISQAAVSSAEADRPRLSLGDNASFKLTLELGVRHDDNIFLSDTAQVSDTILSLTPGLEFNFGQRSLLHGSLMYKEAITRYTGETAPDANLGFANAEIGYESGRLALAASISARQLYQNNRDVAGLGQGEIYRSDVLNIHTSAESPLTAKTTFSVGANIDRTEYETAGLIGSRNLTMPLKIYFEMTPKVSLSTGFTYGKSTPQGGGMDSRDLNYNIGARGNFTSKLSGHLSVGYQTRDVGDNPTESLWGFDGSFDYEMTPQISSLLAISRDFGTGADGSSLQTSSYTFELGAAPTPQWSFATGITYRHVTYGPVVFGSTPPPPTTADRNDDYWETHVRATFLPGRWFNTSLEYTLSTNRSTEPGARYTSNVLNLILGLQY